MARAEKTSRSHPVLRWVIGIAVFIIGFFAYWLSDLFLDKYIGFGTSWIIVGVMAVIALVVWIVDERRLSRDHRVETAHGDD